MHTHIVFVIMKSLLEKHFLTRFPLEKPWRAPLVLDHVRKQSYVGQGKAVVRFRQECAVHCYWASIDPFARIARVQRHTRLVIVRSIQHKDTEKVAGRSGNVDLQKSCVSL